MLDPKKQAEFDQGIAAMSEVLPQMLRGFFCGCIREGFTEEQALQLSKVWLATITQKPSTE